MPERLAVLGQVRPASLTFVDLYTVPAATQAVVSSILVCNTLGTASFFRVNARPTGTAVTISNALFYDVPIAGNATTVLQLGLALAAGHIVSVYSGSGSLTFTATGQEIS